MEADKNGKTPVSMLLEAMVKKRLIPHFELISSTCGTPPSFTFRVTCDGLVATGTGRSKKDAKHEAAKAILDQMAIRNDAPELTKYSLKRSLPTESVIPPKKLRDIPEKNAAGVLIQICGKHYKELPVYKTDDTGPPHAKIFTVTCTVGSLKATGVAKSKKDAKNEASKILLKKVYNEIGESEEQLTTIEIKSEYKKPLPMRKAEGNASTNTQIAPQRAPEKINFVKPEILPIKVEAVPSKTESIPKSIESVKTELPQVINSEEEKTLRKLDEETKKVQNLPIAKNTEKAQVQGRQTRNGNSTADARTSITENVTNRQTLEQVIQKKAQVQCVDVIKTLENAIKKQKIIAIEKNTNSSENKKLDQNSPVTKVVQQKINFNSQLAVSDGYMKKNYDEETRCKMLKEVNSLMKQINDAGSEITKTFVFEKRQNLIEVLKSLNFSYKCVQLETKSSKSVMLIEISKDPDINEIGVAESLHAAEMNGIKQILQVLTKLLVL